MTGADFYSITNKARKIALKRLIDLAENSDDHVLDENSIYLSQEVFDKSLIDFQPTLNEKSLEEYEQYFQRYSNKQP